MPLSFVNPLFLLAWLPMVVTAFLLACRYWKAGAAMVLLAASLLFCAAADPLALAYLVSSILGNFGLHLILRSTEPGSPARSRLIGIGIVANLAPLALLKSLQGGLPAFAASPDNGTIRTAVPLGLAFYTLQQISFLIDASRPGSVQLSLPRYAAWVSFFGQLPAGPVAPYSKMAGQYALLGNSRPASATIARGATLVLAGIIKKSWLADPLAGIVNALFAGAATRGVTPLEAWAAAWGFMLQLYFDFSAYSDIAIGIGLCFGIVLPINFDSPLKSASPGQYVLRWHMSLMMFIRDYVFQPLFQVARRLPIDPTSRRYGIAWGLATLASFLAVSAWHTLALLPFVEAFAVALVIMAVQFVRLRRRRPSPRVRSAPERLARDGGAHLLMLISIALFALLLRADTQAQLARMLPALVDLRAAGGLVTALFDYLTASPTASMVPPRILPNTDIPSIRTLLWLGVATIVALACPNTMQIFGIAGTSRPATRLRFAPTSTWGWIAGALALTALLGMTQSAPVTGFIYARF
jgi:D-alanyl-lipoteichoic acid acyltransferase DltB (MBOAT superfamily)